VLQAGTRRFGPDFVAELNGALDAGGDLPLRPVSLLHLHASQDIGGMAAAFVNSKRFRGRRGLLARTFARLADGDGKTEADLLSYLLFDSRFTSELIALGRRDAERRHEEIIAFFATLLDCREQATTATKRRGAG
jgi:NTE family protein